MKRAIRFRWLAGYNCPDASQAERTAGSNLLSFPIRMALITPWRAQSAQRLPRDAYNFHDLGAGQIAVPRAELIDDLI